MDQHAAALRVGLVPAGDGALDDFPSRIFFPAAVASSDPADSVMGIGPSITWEECRSFTSQVIVPAGRIPALAARAVISARPATSAVGGLALESFGPAGETTAGGAPGTGR
jgi:hypothetical protein